MSAVFPFPRMGVMAARLLLRPSGDVVAVPSGDAVAVPSGDVVAVPSGDQAVAS